ncbi:MAG: DUF1294 domain-containing protein [Hydrogenophaga sp.]|uniref:DUF1294 domain-containing protein n=1 Tax=Hydrogenophaga sp. TaxID=1904254 RepID=UPI001DBF2871|nr:DUF1294 domain-containing protein [Hydrogenophaga sp.]MBX3611506.1 DUF1294 domain-containing protein [Hydrogenophaga sp.]
MKKSGSIVRWDPEHQSGYIRSPQTAAEVYFHLRDYEGPHPVTIGTEVVFDEIVIGGKGPRALSVKLPPPPPLQEAAAAPQVAAEPVLEASAGVSAAARWRERRDERRRNLVATGLLGAWCLLWLIGIAAGRMPWVVITGVVLVNIATLFLYWRDKHVAEEGGWPWPVEHLHAAAVLGGWPAAWVAQHALAHRLEEASFQRTFLACCVVNALGLLLWVTLPLWAG